MQTYVCIPGFQEVSADFSKQKALTQQGARLLFQNEAGNRLNLFALMWRMRQPYGCSLTGIVEEFCQTTRLCIAGHVSRGTFKTATCRIRLSSICVCLFAAICESPRMPVGQETRDALSE
jgi:hypothetical protein